MNQNEADIACTALIADIDAITVEVDALIGSANNSTQKRRQGIKLNSKLTRAGKDFETLQGNDPRPTNIGGARTKLRDVTKRIITDIYGVGVTPKAPDKATIITTADNVMAATSALCNHPSTPQTRREGVKLNAKLHQVESELDSLPQDEDVQACKARLAVAHKRLLTEVFSVDTILQQVVLQQAVKAPDISLDPHENAVRTVIAAADSWCDYLDENDRKEEIQPIEDAMTTLRDWLRQ